MPFEPALINYITAALRLGYTFAEIAKRLTADGYTVPSIEDYEAQTSRLRELPDLAEGGE